jgi:hypothetical protein
MKAFLVAGPVSSGARFIASAITKAGACEPVDDSQQMDKLDFSDSPDHIVLWRRFPHGDRWPDLSQLILCIRTAGYSVVPVVTFRDKDYCIQSQLHGGCHPNDSVLRANYYSAYKHIYQHLAAMELLPVVCHYSSFVSNAEFRALFFEQLGLPCPELELYDANLKYPVVPPRVAGN